MLKKRPARPSGQPVALTSTERCVMYLYRLVSDQARTFIGALLWRAYVHPGDRTEAEARAHERRESHTMAALHMDHVGTNTLCALGNDAILGLTTASGSTLSLGEWQIINAFRTFESHEQVRMAPIFAKVIEQTREQLSKRTRDIAKGGEVRGRATQRRDIAKGGA